MEIAEADGRGAWIRLARAVNTNPGYISQIANGHRKAGLSVARRIAAADRRISLGDLRPDIFGEPA